LYPEETIGDANCQDTIVTHDHKFHLALRMNHLFEALLDTTAFQLIVLSGGRFPPTSSAGQLEEIET